MNLREINGEDFDLILKQDKKIYPTDSPVTEKELLSWYEKNPEFGLIYEDRKKIMGDAIIIPLNEKGWSKLISGKLLESDINRDLIFDNLRDKKIGIHIYHIEKINKNFKEFYKRVFQDLKKIINKLRNSNPELEIIGVSALCVTKEGMGLFEDKLNFKERYYVNPENILEKQGELSIVNINKLKKKESKGWKFRNRCKMLVLYPNEKSFVWGYLN